MLFNTQSGASPCWWNLKRRRGLARVLIGLALVAGALPGVAQSTVEPLSGDVLIAAESLSDSNFGQTVVLLLEAGDNGAAGVVVNRPTLMPLAGALPGLEGLASRDDAVYWGGPVQPGASVVLVRRRRRPSGGEEVVDGVWTVRDKESVELLVADGPSASDLRFFVGYAGWGPGQLEHELGRRDWHLRRGRAEWIFTADGEGLWERLIELSRARLARDTDEIGGPSLRVLSFLSGGA